MTEPVGSHIDCTRATLKGRRPNIAFYFPKTVLSAAVFFRAFSGSRVIIVIPSLVA